MERLDNENEEKTRNQRLTERRTAQISIYKDFVSVLKEGCVEGNRRFRRIETFKEFVTFRNRRIEQSEEMDKINDETTFLSRSIEELESQSVESQMTITSIRGELSQSHTTIAELREEILNRNDGWENMRRRIDQLEEKSRKAQTMIKKIIIKIDE